MGPRGVNCRPRGAFELVTGWRQQPPCSLLVPFQDSPTRLPQCASTQGSQPWTRTPPLRSGEGLRGGVGGDESAHWASSLPSGMANGKRELLACPFRQHGKGFSFFKLSFLSLLMGGHSPYKQTGGENWWENPAICTNRTGPQVCCGLLLSSLVSVGVPPSEL